MSRDLKILFVVDQFDDVMRDSRSPYPGGAEMTDAALVESCPWKIQRVRIQELKTDQLPEFDIHLLGNLSRASREQLREFSRIKRHVLFEHDLRICRYRGNFPEAREPIHRFFQHCICPHWHLRSLYREALGVIFLSHRQRKIYHQNPFFHCSRELVLGSPVMNRSFFERIERFHARSGKKEGVCVAFARGPSKGFDQAIKYCRSRGIRPRIIRDMKPDQALDVFERSSQFVFLPQAPEAAGRMAVEARLLGCDVVVNRYVGVAGEDWWHQSDSQALKYVQGAAARFWKLVQSLDEMHNPVQKK